MGRSGRLALGAIAAAVAAGQIAPSHLGAAIALALASLLLIGETRPRAGVSALLPVVLGAGLIAVRLAVVPAGSVPLDQPPEGDGPWALVVESTGSPRDGAQTATLATPPDADRPFRIAATLPRYPVVIPGDRVVVDGAIRARPDSPYGAYLLRIGAAGTLTSRTLDGPVRPRRPGTTSRGAPPRVRRGPGPGPPGTRSRPGGRDPDRPAGSGRPRPGRGVHDGRGQSRGRHLGLEHRDRGSRDRGTDGSSRSAETIGRDARGDRRLRRVLRGVGVGGPGGIDGRGRAPRPRDRSRGSRRGGARLGRDTPPRL